MHRWNPSPVVICIGLLFSTHAYRFAVVPKRTNSPFFDAVRQGCESQAAKYQNVECIYTGPSDNVNSSERQLEILTELLPTVDGFAVAVKNATAIETLIQQAVKIGKFALTFDSDAENSKRSAYVGTDNYKFGRELAHVLLQLAPDGGIYGLITGGFTSPNILARLQGVRDGLKRSEWVEAEHSPGDGQGNPLIALQEMERLVQLHPDIGAIIPVGGWPMFEADEWEAFVNRHPQIVTVCADALEVQLQLMNRGAANGLVGQLPFQMGQLAIEKLHQLKKNNEEGLPPPFPNGTKFATSVLNVLQIPQNLPPLQEDMNYIGSLAILGYVLCGIIMVTCITFAAWTFWNRKSFIVKSSQPAFLYMILFGVLIMASAIIPLTIDDEKFSLEGCSIACMCVPWLISIGFVTTFSALFSKTWRINQIYRNAQQFRRVKVTARDVLVPFAVLMTLNVIVLLCWTLIAPLQYERRAHSGTDNWNRVSRSYYGACVGPDDVKGGAVPYVVCLTVINLSVIVISNMQAYQARKIKTEYAESKYIFLIMLTMLQSYLLGLPILALVRDDPQASFVVLTVIIFATCMATLLFLFIPKMTKRAERESANRGSTSTTRQGTSISMQRPSSSVEAIRRNVAAKQSAVAASSELFREEESKGDKDVPMSVAAAVEEAEETVDDKAEVVASSENRIANGASENKTTSESASATHATEKDAGR